MTDYELLLSKEDKYKEFYRYRLNAFYYLTVLVIVIFLVANFLNYNPDGEAVPSAGVNFQPDRNFITSQKSGQELPVTTTPSSPSVPYKYGNLPKCDLSKDAETPLINAKEATLQFFRCASMILMRFARNPEGLLFNWPYTIYVCDEEDEIMKIPLQSFDNGEKQYWAVLPRCQEKSTFITLGTGNNSKAEDDLRAIVQNITSFGTDPFLNENKRYDHFYQTAISNNETKLQMNNEATLYNVTATDQAVFFNETVAAKKIDMLWINPNAGNFQYWKYLNLDGEFDKLGIIVCQLNIEITKSDAKHWEKFIMPLVRERRYVFMRPMATQGGNVTRTFFLNAKDRECVRKYLQ
ncbi:unnamed protein product [Caenorhabditis sp. 36 PRJEB53466]|nr:unnamed protein product [Caenorhabditis sp. 36 PRJEB53466]